MAFSDAKDLALTLKSLYGDLADFPFLQPRARERSAPATATATASEALSALAAEIRFCERCELHIGRHQLVFGRGLPEARIAFVGDFPSDADDEAGLPFSDESGDLLRKMIVAMKLQPEETYLTNVFKCRPPRNHRVEQDLFRACENHLERQFDLLSARFVVAMGEHAARALSRSESPLPVLRGQIYDWRGRSVFCTYHPRDLLASPARKKEAWSDLQAVMRAMERQK